MTEEQKEALDQAEESAQNSINEMIEARKNRVPDETEASEAVKEWLSEKAADRFSGKKI